MEYGDCTLKMKKYMYPLFVFKSKVYTKYGDCKLKMKKYMYLLFVRPGIIEHIVNKSIHVTVVCMPRNDCPFVCPGKSIHLSIMCMPRNYCIPITGKVVTPFVGNKECISCWFSGVATSRVPEPSPMTVADHILAR